MVPAGRLIVINVEKNQQYQSNNDRLDGTVDTDAFSLHPLV